MSDKVDLDDISSSKPEEITPTDSAQAELNLLAAKQKTFEGELGRLGKLFGGRSEKPGNISGLVIVICFLLIFVLLLVKIEEEKFGMSSGNLITAFAGIITLTLGYLFGSNTKD